MRSLCAAFCVEVNCQSQCSPVGPNNEMEFTAAAVTPPSVYLNVDYPARCSGTVERWEFCFYRPATHKQNDSYRLTFAVYRGNGSGNNTRYEIVGSSLHTITRRFGVESSNFSCQFLDRNVGNLRQFNIEAGDIIGACIFDPTNPSIEPMDAISAASGYSLMQDTQSVGTPCGFRQMPSTIPRSRLLTVNSRLLHLSAIVAGMFTDCKINVHVATCVICITYTTFL